MTLSLQEHPRRDLPSPVLFRRLFDGRRRRPRITLIEDDAAIAVMYRLQLVSDGFDVDPAKFYRPDASPAGEAGKPASEGALEKAALEAARTAAALGWTAFPLPMGDSSLPDLRRVRQNPTPQVPLGGKIILHSKKPEEAAKDQAPAPPALLAPQQPLQLLPEQPLP